MLYKMLQNSFMKKNNNLEIKDKIIKCETFTQNQIKGGLKKIKYVQKVY